MAQPRLQVLSRELRGVGLTPEDAKDFAVELSVHHPLLKANGGRELRKRLVLRGVKPGAARELVLTLLAFELLSHRVPFASVLRELSAHEHRIGEARSAAMLGAGLLREIRPPVRAKPPGWRRWLRRSDSLR